MKNKNVYFQWILCHNNISGNESADQMAKVVGLQIYPKRQMFWSSNVCRSHSNQVDSNWLQENVGQNLTNIQKEPTNPKIY